MQYHDTKRIAIGQAADGQIQCVMQGVDGGSRLGGGFTAIHAAAAAAAAAKAARRCKSKHRCSRAAETAIEIGAMVGDEVDLCGIRNPGTK